jgi:hypothetical protein
MLCNLTARLEEEYCKDCLRNFVRWLIPKTILDYRASSLRDRRALEVGGRTLTLQRRDSSSTIRYPLEPELDIVLNDKSFF